MNVLPMFHILMYFSAISRHLKQLGLVGEDSGMLRITLGVAILALGGIFAFRYFANRYSLVVSFYFIQIYNCYVAGPKFHSEDAIKITI